MRSGKGSIAALDQGGPATPKALAQYGIAAETYTTEEEMFDLIHALRSRIIQSPAFNGERVLGAILFDGTIAREIGGKPAATYLWEDRGVIPFMKIDDGLEAESDGVCLMKPIANLENRLKQAVEDGVYGTKSRSVINAASESGISGAVTQQFELSQKILAAGLMPIIEPEITITISDKAEAENILLAELTKNLDALADDQQVILKLSLPSKPNQYQFLVNHPKILRLVSLSGGYLRNDAIGMLAENTGMIASFSRALTEGLDVSQSDADFNSTLDASVQSIFDASVAG